ncbi:MAG: hypothetical protein K9N05_08010, partial [Candidatus Marinimicrobia bacterium]|nr:hypothetical protein [Candidatus Neomarinimicrobiota bacterium]
LRDVISGGSVTLKYWNNFLSARPKQGYEISVNHPQKIGRFSSLNINGSYTNDRTRYEDELDIDEKLEQQMVSRATFRTQLGPFSMSLNASHTEDLRTGTSTTYLPQFSLSKSRANVFKRKSKSQPERWYHKFTYNISSNLSNKFMHTWNEADSVFYDKQQNKLQTNMGVQYNNKILGFLNVSPYLNYYEDWTMLYMAPETRNDSALVDEDGDLILSEINGFKRRGRFNLGTSASTTLYGIFNLNLGPLKAVRHTMNMSLNFVYRPDQSNNPNYVYHGVDINGEEVSYDYFASTLLGRTPSSQSQTFNMSFNHNFDSKTINKQGDEKKTTFLNIKHSYNFLADSLKSSYITATSTIKDLPGGMDLKIDATFDPYDYRVTDDGSINRINQLAIPRMTQLRLNTGFVIKPKEKGQSELSENNPDSTSNADGPQNPVIPKGADTGFDRWSINSGVSFVSNASDPLNIKNSLLITTTMKAYLSPKWSGTYRINFDVLEQKITDQRLSLVRDLHCWTLALDWRPGKSIFLRMNAKSSLLKDFKMLQKKSYY